MILAFAIHTVLFALSLEEHADISVLPNPLLLAVPRPLIRGGRTRSHCKTAIASRLLDWTVGLVQCSRVEVDGGDFRRQALSTQCAYAELLLGAEDGGRLLLSTGGGHEWRVPA